MKTIVESLSNPFWQVGSGILATCAIVCVLIMRSPEARLNREKQRLGTRLVLLLATLCWLLLSTGVLALHVIQQKNMETSSPPSTTISTPTVTPTTGATPTPLETPTPLPILAQSPTQVLTIYCNAINTKDTTTMWETYAKSLQDTLRANATHADSTKHTFVSCDSTHIDVQGVVGFLLMQTIDSSGNNDGLARPYKFTLQVQDQAWKIQGIAYCLSDACLDFTGWMAP